jgi:Phage integrase family
VIPLDDETLRAFARHRVDQAEERLRAGASWEDHDVIIATHIGRPVMPRSLDRALEVLIAETGLPKLTSHGLRHIAATHMVRGSRERRRVASRSRRTRPLARHAHAGLRPRPTRQHEGHSRPHRPAGAGKQFVSDAEEREPPRYVWYTLEEALELLAALEDAREALIEAGHLTVVVSIEAQVRELSRRLDFDDPRGGTDAG